MKTCSRCKKNLPLGEFGKSSKAKDGLQWHCRSCKAELHQKNHDKRMECIRNAKNKRVQRNTEYIAKWFQSHACVDCENKDIRVLEFDHVAKDKVDGVMRLVRGGYSLKMIKEEISKCEVRCRNCHTIKTYERMGGSWHDHFLASVSPLPSKQEKA